MIRLDNVSHFYGRGYHVKCVLNQVTCLLDTSQSIGVLGLNGSGKSTLLRLIGGAMRPTSGQILRNTCVSWPLGLNGFNGSLTGEENLRFVSRIYGVEPRVVFRFVADFAELGRDLFRPVRTYSSGMRSRLSLALSLAIHFDVYLIDEGLSVGDVRFQERYAAALKDRFSNSRVIIVSHQMSTIKEYCRHATVLHRGKLTNVLPLSEAQRVYQQCAEETPPMNQ